MATDTFKDYRRELHGPATFAEAVTPSDSVDLTNVTTKIYVGGTGHLSVITAAGDTVLFSALPVGTILDLRVSRIRATDTTATLIVAMS